MSDPVSVTIQEDPLPVIVDTGTPKVTITDNATQAVTVLESPPVTISSAEGNPTVVISSGGVGSITTTLDSLVGKLSRIHMDTALASDLDRLQSLWIRVGNELLLTYPEGVAIEEAGRQYTDTSIADTVADINVSVDGKIDIKYSQVTQEVAAIDQRVTQIQGETDARMTVAESRILQTEDSITQSVSRLDTLDGPGGAVALLQTAITQNQDSITLEAQSRQQVADDLQAAQSNISLLTDSISLLSTTIDTVSDRVTSAEIILGEGGINLSVVQEALGQHEYSIGTIQTLLTNQWGVTITEDVNGNKYTTGFGLLLHPVWVLAEVYVPGNTVIYQDVIYECLVGHTADVTNSPQGTSGTTYWKVLPDGVKSEFAVQAEAFKVWNGDTVQPLFQVQDGKVSVNTELIVASLQSQNYGNPGESWFKLDPASGTAEFNNTTMHFGSGSTGYNNLVDKPISLSEINAEEVAILALGVEPVYATTEPLTPNVNTDITGATEVTFQSARAGGVLIYLEVPDGLEDNVHAALNDVPLTQFEWDCGGLTDDVDYVIDQEEAGEPIDLGRIV